MSRGTTFRVSCAAGLTAMALIGAGCSSGSSGGGGGDGTDTGQFLDSAVENLDWEAGSILVSRRNEIRRRFDFVIGGIE